jgi:hypothetical protein
MKRKSADTASPYTIWEVCRLESKTTAITAKKATAPHAPTHTKEREQG